MPVKRRTAKGRQLVITPEIVGMFLAADEMIEDGSSELWEPLGRRRECLDLSVELHAALGRLPHEEEVLFADDPEPPEWMLDNERRAASYRDAYDVRCRILDAIDAAAKKRAF